MCVIILQNIVHVVSYFEKYCALFLKCLSNPFDWCITNLWIFARKLYKRSLYK